MFFKDGRLVAKYKPQMKQPTQSSSIRVRLVIDGFPMARMQKLYIANFQNFLQFNMQLWLLRFKCKYRLAIMGICIYLSQICVYMIYIYIYMT